MDIVEELRERCEVDPWNVSLLTRAADEIERLRADSLLWEKVCKDSQNQTVRVMADNTQLRTKIFLLKEAASKRGVWLEDM